MKKEEKQLLLNDLCGRLPYGVKIKHRGQIQELHLISPNGTFMNYEYNAWFPIETCKPYLRPMSSMTMSEELEFTGLCLKDAEIENMVIELSEFYNKKHLDYRGLIEKGLALEAPEDMYKI